MKSGGAGAADFIVPFAVQKKSPQISKISKMVQGIPLELQSHAPGTASLISPSKARRLGTKPYRCPMLIGWLSNEVRSAVAEPIGKQ